MHISFIPYGRKEEVELLLNDMRAQKHWLPMTKGTESKKILMTSSLRIMPFGIYEYVFSKEDLDDVLNTLTENGLNEYNIPKLYLKILRKLLKLKPVPEFEKKNKFTWLKQFVGIIILGIREDGEIVGKGELDNGWTHEAI